MERQSWSSGIVGPFLEIFRVAKIFVEIVRSTCRRERQVAERQQSETPGNQPSFISGANTHRSVYVREHVSSQIGGDASVQLGVFN